MLCFKYFATVNKEHTKNDDGTNSPNIKTALFLIKFGIVNKNSC